MTREELLKALTYIVSKCDNIINNKNYTADDFVQDTIEDIAEVCNMILDGKYGDILEPQPPLPSNLDEAAKESMPRNKGFLEIDIYGGSEAVYSREQMLAMFKAGAEWMAGQGSSFECEVCETPQGQWAAGLHLCNCADKEQSALKEIGAKDYDKVIVQIRRK